jgi:hypothetical protein
MLDYSTYFRTSNPNAQLVNLGKLYLPSGRIYCCDPFLSDEVAALETTIAPGSYDVQLSIATSPEWGPRVALGGLVTSAEPTIAWREASYQSNHEPASSFRVDAGLACFMDAETQQLFTKVIDNFYRERPDSNYYDDILAREFNLNAEPNSPRQDGDWALHYPVPGDPRNIAMFATGLGDGYYSAYWGFDQSQRPSMLVADFQLIDEDEEIRS